MNILNVFRLNQIYLGDKNYDSCNKNLEEATLVLIEQLTMIKKN